MIIFGDGVIIETSKMNGIFIEESYDKFYVKADMNCSYVVLKTFNTKKEAEDLLEDIYNNWSQNVTGMRV